jgi:hypothetical protein
VLLYRFSALHSSSSNSVTGIGNYTSTLLKMTAPSSSQDEILAILKKMQQDQAHLAAQVETLANLVDVSAPLNASRLPSFSQDPMSQGIPSIDPL